MLKVLTSWKYTNGDLRRWPIKTAYTSGEYLAVVTASMRKGEYSAFVWLTPAQYHASYSARESTQKSATDTVDTFFLAHGWYLL